jgi:hypothetical protein
MTTQGVSQRLTFSACVLVYHRHQERLILRVQNDNRFEILTVSTGGQLLECAEQDLTDLPEKDLPG